MRERFEKIRPLLQPLFIVVLLVTGCRMGSREAGEKISQEAARKSAHALTPAARKSLDDAVQRAFAAHAGEEGAREAAREAVERAFREGRTTLSEEERAKLDREVRLAARGETEPDRIEEIEKETLNRVLDCLYEDDIDRALGKESAADEGGDCFSK